jgi:hypothetical protein
VLHGVVQHQSGRDDVERHRWERYAQWFLGLTDGAGEQTKDFCSCLTGRFSGSDRFRRSPIADPGACSTHTHRHAPALCSERRGKDACRGCVPMAANVIRRLLTRSWPAAPSTRPPTCLHTTRTEDRFAAATTVDPAEPIALLA